MGQIMLLDNHSIHFVSLPWITPHLLRAHLIQLIIAASMMEWACEMYKEERISHCKLVILRKDLITMTWMSCKNWHSGWWGTVTRKVIKLILNGLYLISWRILIFLWCWRVIVFCLVLYILMSVEKKRACHKW